MTIDEAFGQLKGVFAIMAQFQGGHFKYAAKNGVVMLEIKRNGRFYYWLLIDGRFVLVHASLESRLRSMRTVTDCLDPKAEYVE